MVALIPLLPNLSAYDAKRLVYALFIQPKKDIPSYSPLEASAGKGFSECNMNFGSLWTYKLPVAKDNDADLTLLVEWIKRGRYHNFRIKMES
jgi:hypothetical protein